MEITNYIAVPEDEEVLMSKCKNKILSTVTKLESSMQSYSFCLLACFIATVTN